ncbi:potassium channel family protein [Aspergillus fumigatus Af293]|uniref:Potassium channel, putative n=1 Tax=Aspergillus fumigatus (strain ATCC MYA-4609 / CBS 101355 / FGSC A1100 / Af293) TaxID=330879 RepID=Q4WWY4_ASPFU|nr:potassium channel, putative [Aspergillus fumigatus Af293]EAL92819.1 potassium channel, putative [Aspergillus fumigatus Af293]
MVNENSQDEAQNIIEEVPHHALSAWWWLASTAYPLLAGTLGPMASAFSICSLSQDWGMESEEGNGQPRGIGDPDWVIVVNTISLGCAIMSNFVLLWGMARRIAFSIAQPIIIIGWYISSLLLTCLLCIFAASKVQNDSDSGRHRWLTGSYYYGAFAAGLYFVLSSLLLITVYGVCRGHYSREFRLTTSQRSLMLQTILFLIYLLGGAAVYARIEGWRYLDAVYWADLTLLTIGIGDFVPETHKGRGLLFPYAVGGILIPGLIVGSIRAQMLEKGRQKMAETVAERTRRFLVREAFQLMRRVRQIATLERKWISLATALTVWTMLWVLGAIAFWLPGQNEKLTYFEALYFAYTTLFTIGYGDFHATSEWERPFFVFWTLLAVPTVTLLIANVEEQERNAIEADGHRKEESARARGDVTVETIHHHHYMLFREVRRMMDYATRNLHKEFDYQEWEYFLNLIASDGGETDGEEGNSKWDWTGYKSPLLGQKTEVQWLLEALTEALERELRKASRGYHLSEQSEFEQ